MFNPIVNIIRKENRSLERVLFSDIRKGDTFFYQHQPITAGSDAHISEDASYNGYIIYDDSPNMNSWFPEDLI